MPKWARIVCACTPPQRRERAAVHPVIRSPVLAALLWLLAVCEGQALPLTLPAANTQTIESTANASGFGALGRSTVCTEVGDAGDVDRRGLRG